MGPREMRSPGGMGARGFFFRINMQNDACNLFPDRAIILGIKQTQISDQMRFIIRREEGGFWGRIRYLRIERRGFNGRLPNGYIQNAQSSPALARKSTCLKSSH